MCFSRQNKNPFKTYIFKKVTKNYKNAEKILKICM